MGLLLSSVRIMRNRVRSFVLRSGGARLMWCDDIATLTLSLLPNGPTAHFRLTGITLCQNIKVRPAPAHHPITSH